MRFLHRKRRKTPTVIIIALIDVLIVVLIFMMVATTFKSQQPSVRVTLPESGQSDTSSEMPELLVVTVGKEAPFFYLGEFPVTFDSLRTELKASASRNHQVNVAIRSDIEAPFGEVFRVMNAAREEGIRVMVQTRLPASP